MKHLTIGPRGGMAQGDVCCDTCVCSAACSFSGPKTRALGCFDWVDPGGRRVPTREQEEQYRRDVREEHVLEEYDPTHMSEVQPDKNENDQQEEP